MIKTFVKKPVKVQAIQWTGDNCDEIDQFIGSGPFDDSHHFIRGQLIVHTLEGDHQALVGDWIIRGVKGEFYPCKPDIFEQTYEEVST